MKFYAISRWKNTSSEFVFTTFGSQTAEEAEASARKNEQTYNDQFFLRVIQAQNWNEAKKFLR